MTFGWSSCDEKNTNLDVRKENKNVSIIFEDLWTLAKMGPGVATDESENVTLQSCLF